MNWINYKDPRRNKNIKELDNYLDKIFDSYSLGKPQKKHYSWYFRRVKQEYTFLIDFPEVDEVLTTLGYILHRDYLVGPYSFKSYILYFKLDRYPEVVQALEKKHSLYLY